MFPLQMHQMVQPPSHLDPLLQPHHLKHDYLLQHHPSHVPRQLNPYPNLSPTPRGFGLTLRSGQPTSSLHRNPNTFSHTNIAHTSENDGEHSLRRKTPSGTIDNGYDGSHLASGPPPLKHMILPTETKIFPRAVVDRSAHSLGGGLRQSLPPGGWPYPATSPINGVDHGLETTSPVAPPGLWGPGPPSLASNPAMTDHAGLLQSLPQPSYHPVTSLQPILGPGYQQAANHVPFNPAGYRQPRVWRDGSVMDLRTTIPLANAYTPQNAVIDSAYMPTQPTMHPGLPNGLPMGPPYTFRLPLASFPLDDGFSRRDHNNPLLQSSQRRFEALSLSPVAGTGGNGSGDSFSPARFKERVLAHAHKTYTDLLVYLSHSKKMHPGRHGSVSRSSSKMVVFPKPPKQLTASLNAAKARPSQLYPETTSSFSQHVLQTQAAGSLPFGARLDSRPLATPNVNMVDPALSGTPVVPAEIYGNMGLIRNPYSGKVHRGMAEVNSPPLNAKGALELLTNLCEQSGWKWIDGMLLGGCLHYGLEHYEEALEWFKRITSLEEGHVEAISNIAATLYCLERHEEAERSWWRAVQARPSYLEAAEHLVGLLCSSQRSQDAVKLIKHIQDALKLPGSSTAGDQGSETGSETDTASTATVREQSPDGYVLDTATGSSELTFSAAAAVEHNKQPGFGSSGYAIPGSENGRMLLLIHAKANMLYTLKEAEQASEAFEEAVMISTGRHTGGIQTLIRTIQNVLYPREPGMLSSGGSRQATRPATPLLLPPEKARNTAQLVFARNHGQLPGLAHVQDGSHKRSAIATTSNSLLSLAKIFQDTVSNGGSSPGMARQSTGVGDILALYYLSLSLQESPSTANNVGILLASVQPSASQQVTFPETSLAMAIPGIVPGSGLALALAYYNYGLTLDPKHVHLHTNLGSLLKDIGQLDMAISMYEKAVACDGTFDIALTNLANAVKDRGRISDAIVYYKRAVTSNPDFAEAVCGLSTALNSVCDWKGRGGVFLQDGDHDRWHVDDDGMLQDVKRLKQGGGLMKRVVDIVGKQLKESASWGQGLLQEHSIRQLASQLRDAGAKITDPTLDIEAMLRQWAGRPWEGSRVLRLMERAMRAATRSWYQDKYVRRMPSPVTYSRPRPPASLSVPGAPTVLPFHTFTCPLTAKDIRMISERNALRISCSTLRAPWLPATTYEPPEPPSPHLNVGYVSSDFNNHPLAHLMQSVFGFHDQTRVKAYCYATTASDKSVHRQQIEREAPVFHDVSSWSSDKLVDQIVKDGIHILVNLNGYTRGARNEVFAARPAPIQMSFMGFAGTLGAEWCDYLLADSTAIPPSTLRPYRSNLNLTDVFRDEAEEDQENWIYAENIVFCRDTFFCCDHAQSADETDERSMSWEEEQQRRWKMRKELFPSLPDDAVIFGNFNQLYKIEPTTFRTWLRILSEAKNAYLWLLRFPELGENNLRRTAMAWAGEDVAKRLIFTDVAPKQQHISRARVCDLFLDTPECNAHTTAADVLWSSTPLLTLPRYEYKMCSRMAASILKGALPKGPDGDRAASELIAADDDEYQRFATNLARNFRYRMSANGYGEGVGRLAELRKLLWKSKWTCALFDTRRWVRDLEDAYDEAWRRWVAGESGDIYL